MKLSHVLILILTLPAWAETIAPTEPSGASYTRRKGDLERMWEWAAERSYERFHGACATKTTSDPVDELSYLVKLASNRAEALDCSLKQVKSLQQDEDKRAALAEDLSTKLSLLMILKRQSLDYELAFRTNTGLTAERKQEYSKILASQEAILASIPFIETASMQQFIKSQFQLHKYGEGAEPPLEDLSKAMNSRSGVASALSRVQVELQGERETLNKGIETGGRGLGIFTKESLAQDRGLVAAVQDGAKPSDQEVAAACWVDAKYGRGAIKRDQILLGAQVGLTVATLGATGLATGGTFGAIRGAAAAGQISSRTALTVLSRAALITDIGVGAVQTAKACGPGNAVGGTSHAENCESFEVKRLRQNNCALTAALNGTGVAALIPRARNMLARLTGVESRSSEDLSRYVDVVHWRGSRHIDLLTDDGRLVRTDTREAKALNPGYFDMATLEKETTRVRVAVSESEMKDIDKRIEAFTVPSTSSLDAARRSATGDGVTCAAMTCKLIGPIENGAYIVPQGIRQWPTLTEAYLRGRAAMPKDSRVIAVYTAKGPDKYPVYKRLEAQAAGLIGGLWVPGTYVIVQYKLLSGEVKEIAIPTKQYAEK